MRKNALFDYIKPVTDKASTEKSRYVDYSEILVMWEKVMKMMEEGFEAMESRFKVINDQLAHVNELIKQMGISKQGR